MRALALAAALVAGAGEAGADGVIRLEGHGGPVRAMAATEGLVATGGFDNAVGLWRPEDGAHLLWLDGHEAAVNAVTFAGPGRALSSGDDFDAILWDLETGAPIHRLEGHKGKVMGLAVTADGALAATASWDGSIGLWPLPEGAPRFLGAYRLGSVNSLAFAEGGDVLYAASSDGTIRRFDVAKGALDRAIIRHGFGVNVLTLDEPAGWLAYGAVDGGTRAISLDDGRVLADLTLDRRPILAMARSPDGARLAVGDAEGYVMIVNTADWSIAHDFRVALRGPVWALAWADDARLVVGGLDEVAAIWPVGLADAPQIASGVKAYQRPAAEMSNGERQFARKCSICHSLTAETDRRAGPTLRALFGRRAGTQPDYVYSDALDGSPIIWDDATIDALFDIGPDHYIPGTKMPMQRITRPEDRADLIDYLRTATAP